MFLGRKTTKAKRKNARRNLTIEGLEDRQMLTAVLNGSTLVVTGTGAGDSILVAGTDQLVVTTNGSVDGTFDASDVNLIRVVGQQGNDFITIDSSEKSEIYGGPGNDQLRGGSGKDTIYGGDGNDGIDAGADDDIVWGGGGNDIILGGDGVDRLNGEAGDDQIEGQNGRSFINGGLGNDVLLGGPTVDEIQGGDGNDQLFGLGGNDKLWGQAGDDGLDGGDGNDRFSVATEPIRSSAEMAMTIFTEVRASTTWMAKLVVTGCMGMAVTTP